MMETCDSIDTIGENGTKINENLKDTTENTPELNTDDQDQESEFVNKSIPWKACQRNKSNMLFEPRLIYADQDPNDEENDDLKNLNFNVNNYKYIPPLTLKKCYLAPKLISSSLAIKNRQHITNLYALDFSVVETMKFKTQFPQTLCYDRLCPKDPPYISPLLISLLFELEKHIPPLSKLAGGSSQQTLEAADSLFNSMITVQVNNKIPKHIAQIFYLNVPINVLTNALQVFFQRLKYPLFLATSEFCHFVTSNQYNIKFVQFGCHKCYKDNPLIKSLARCLAISSNFQIANLAYFIEICQRWVQMQIKCQLDNNPLGSAERIYEDAMALLAILFGKSVVGVPQTFVAHKLINDALPLVDDIRRVTLYFLLGIPPFEFWHLWSINTLCFEDTENKCKCKRGAFTKVGAKDYVLETLPNL